MNECKEEVIKAAEVLKAYCDNMQIFSHGCRDCPLELLCECIQHYHDRDKLSVFMKDVAHEVKYSYA